MSLPILVSILTNFIFGAIAIVISIKEEEDKKNFAENEKGKLMAMIRGLEDGVFMLDTGNRLIVINDAAKAFLGISRDEVDEEDIFVSLANKFDLSTTIAQVMKDLKPFEAHELTLFSKTVQIFVHPVHDTRSGKVLGVSVLLHDITLEKNLSRHKEDFTNMVVHELRAPLTAIKGSSELLVKSQNLPPESEKKMLEIINTQAGRMLSEVSTLLDAAKLDSGKFTISKSTNDLEQLIRERVQFFLPQALEKHIALSFSDIENIPAFSFDAFRIEQVLNNLLSNSLKFTPQYGQITVGAKRQDESVVIWVSDTGVGIPKEKQQNLFSKFYQVNTTPPAIDPQKKENGTGLGLYILKGIVQAHGGKVFVESQMGHGTTISFTIPFAREESKPQTSEVPVSMGRVVN